MYQTKGVIYSIKLKLEFAILGKLVKFVGGNKVVGPERKESVGFVNAGSVSAGKDPTAMDTEMDVREFVNLDRVATDISHPSRGSGSMPSRRKSARQGNDLDLDLARFEHVEDVTALNEVSSSASSLKMPNGHV